VLCELQATILVGEVDAAQGGFTIREQVSTLPASYAGPMSGAAVKFHPSMETLYVSNRIHDTISVFTIGKADGALSLAGRFASLGQDPRDCEFDRSGRWLLSANQSSGTVVPFELEPQTGLPTGRSGEAFECGTPVCVIFE
jgi:6-phosphogluconolactonase